MPNMSFALTTEAVRLRRKTVTRRLGWVRLKVGTRVRAVVKCQGLKKGEKVEPLCFIDVVGVRRERLDTITADDVRREGFEMTPAEFVAMFCQHNRCIPDTVVTRIEFTYCATQLTAQ